jgi:uncharacterized membrane protein
MSTALIVLLGAVFLACAVEAVEALTVLLAIGLTRDWRSAWQGVAAGIAVLALVVAALGPALTRVPIGGLRLVVGALLLVFGLQWLRKAVLRAGGVLGLHDEPAIFNRAVARAAGAPAGRRAVVRDWYGFTVVFKAVVLEGLEVAFIVLTFGTGQHATGWAAIAAVAAIAVVAVAGAIVRGPLARVPENAMKFVVGVLLTTFGAFWAGEGAGARYPGGDAFITVILVLVAVAAAANVAVIRRRVTVHIGVSG